jgi:hypothetical protein
MNRRGELLYGLKPTRATRYARAWEEVGSMCPRCTAVRMLYADTTPHVVPAQVYACDITAPYFETKPALMMMMILFRPALST